MKKILLSLSLFLMPMVGRAATQIYIPSTSTYHNYVINIESGTIRNLNVSTFTVSSTISSSTISNLTVSTLTVTRLETISSSTITNLTVSTIIVNNLYPSNISVTESNTQPQFFSNTSTTSGVRINTDDTVALVSRGGVGVRVNASRQVITGDGTSCLPGFVFGTDAGSGMFLPSVDNLGFSAGCSTGIVIHKHDFPLPLDKTIANIYTITGGSATATGTNSAVNVGIYTSSVTTTNNQVAECDQYSCQITIEGHDAAGTLSFTDEIRTSFYTVTPLVISSHDDLGSPAVRTYSSGGSSTGIILCKVASGNYLTQAYIIQLSGK